MQKDPNISDLDGTLIERMVKELKLHNTSTGRAAKYVNHLLVAGRKIHEITGGKRDFDTFTKEDRDNFKIWLTYLLFRKYKVLAQRTAIISRYLVA
jgi:hypothetical protein